MACGIRSLAVVAAFGGALAACAGTGQTAAAPGSPSAPAAPGARARKTAPPPATAPELADLGEWTVTQGVAAPGAPAAAAPDARQLDGAQVHFAPSEVVAPAPLGCAGARYEFALTPAGGLFQGSLPAPQESAARALGATRLPVLTLRVTCAGGAFDYHLVTPDRALTARGGVVWTLERDVPATEDPADPAGAVLALLDEHMTGDMGFDPETIARKRAFLSPGLESAIDAYFARPSPEDEVPPVDGDPFTDSQEYPARFALGRAVAEGEQVIVPVFFRDDYRERRVDYVLRRGAGRWLLHDLRFEDGGTLRDLLLR